MSRPKSVEFEIAIRDFLSLAAVLEQRMPLTADDVLGVIVKWYTESRIMEACDKCDDMLLLQWGEHPFFPQFAKPMDMRLYPDGSPRLSYLPQRVPYIDFTRQVFPSAIGPDVEFDDAAVQMSVMLGYGYAPERHGNLWIESPGDTGRGVEEFRSVAFIRQMLNSPADRFAAFVHHCG